MQYIRFSGSDIEIETLNRSYHQLFADEFEEITKPPKLWYFVLEYEDGQHEAKVYMAQDIDEARKRLFCDDHPDGYSIAYIGNRPWGNLHV